MLILRDQKSYGREYGTIASDKSFILISGDEECMSGDSFESDIDLNNVKVIGVEEVIIVNNGYQTLEAKNLMKVW